MSSSHAEEASGQLSEDTLAAAETIWRYMNMNHSVRKSDAIIALGSNDLRVPEVAADLYLQGMGDWLVMSGKCGNLTVGKWPKTEAEMFYDVAVKIGVPPDRILVEKEATNSGENVTFTYKLLKSRNLIPKSIILVQKPYMERRAYATWKKQWPHCDTTDIVVTSPRIPMLEYPNVEVGTLSDIITVFVGDLHRISLYGDQGFQTHQDISEEVWKAYTLLRETGQFDGHLSKQ